MLDRAGTRFLIVGFLVLVMAIPMFMIGSIVDGRLDTARDVQSRLSGEWGGPAVLVGPHLVVPVEGPVRRTVEEQVTNPQTGETRSVSREVTVRGQQSPLVFLPEQLNGNLVAKVEERRRGIFIAPVYTSEIALDFDFSVADAASMLGEGAEPMWNQAIVELGLSSNAGIRGETSLMRGSTAVRLEPLGEGQPGIFGSVGDPRSGPASFSLKMTLNGADQLMISPVGRTTRITMTGDWPHPSFGGAFLPGKREVGAQGYKAEWVIPHLARPLAQISRGLDSDTERQQAFGIEFFQPNDFYSKAYRATTYSILLIAMTFLTVLLTERGVTGRPAHPVQYILIGLAQSVFVLLMVSYAEHIGFGLAYLGASAATIALLTLFGAIGLKLGRRVWVLSSLLIVLYAVLYLILRSSDFALLAGATLAFVAIAATMIATRNEDWYGPPRAPKAPKGQPPAKTVEQPVMQPISNTSD